MNSLFIVQIWDYYHDHFWPLIISFFLVVGSILFSELGFHYFVIPSIVIATFILLRSYLKITNVFGLFRGLLFFVVIITVFIYCFSNIYIDLGIVNNKVTTSKFEDTIYFSIVTWTTLGYGDFQPSETARIWAALEAMLGYIYMGLLVGLIISGLTPQSSRFTAKRPQNKWGHTPY